MKLWANQGRTILNPRHVRAIFMESREKPGSGPDEEYQYRLMARSDLGDWPLDPGWYADEHLARLDLCSYAQLITPPGGDQE